MRQNLLMLALAGSTLAACGGGSDTPNATTATPKLLSGGVSMAATLACDAWSASAVYTVDMCVTYNGATYKAKWWTKNNVPGAKSPM